MYGSNDYAVLLLHRGGHLDASHLTTVLVVAFFAFFMSAGFFSFMGTRFFILVACFFLVRMLPATAIGLISPIVEAAPQGNGQD